MTFEPRWWVISWKGDLTPFKSEKKNTIGAVAKKLGKIHIVYTVWNSCNPLKILYQTLYFVSCIKKYCICYNAGIKCSYSCLCRNCLNRDNVDDGAKSGMPTKSVCRLRKSNLLFRLDLSERWKRKQIILIESHILPWHGMMDWKSSSPSKSSTVLLIFPRPS